MVRLILHKNIPSLFYSSRFYSNSFRYYSTYPSSFFKFKLKSNSDQVYDFRSDTVTKPTDEMFDIMRNASRGDDVFNVNVLYFTYKFSLFDVVKSKKLLLLLLFYQEDESTYELETYIAELTGHETALFAPSGTMVKSH